MKASQFFPKPADIIREIDMYQERRSFERGEEEFRTFKRKQEEYLRNGGELVGFQDVIDQFQKVAGKEVIGKIGPIIGDPAEEPWCTPLNLSSDRKNEAHRRLAEWNRKRNKSS